MDECRPACGPQHDPDSTRISRSGRVAKWPQACLTAPRVQDPSLPPRRARVDEPLLLESPQPLLCARFRRCASQVPRVARHLQVSLRNSHPFVLHHGYPPARRVYFNTWAASIQRILEDRQPALRSLVQPPERTSRPSGDAANALLANQTGGQSPTHGDALRRPESRQSRNCAIPEGLALVLLPALRVRRAERSRRSRPGVPRARSHTGAAAASLPTPVRSIPVSIPPGASAGPRGGWLHRRRRLGEGECGCATEAATRLTSATLHEPTDHWRRRPSDASELRRFEDECGRPHG